jgi:phage gp45-like
MSEDYFHHRNNAHRYETTKVEDKGDIQLVEATGMDEEEHTEIMRVQPHGFSSHPPKGSHFLAVGLGGRRDNLVAIGGEHQDYRIKELLEGESVQYDTKGNFLRMLLDKGMSMYAKVGAVLITAKEKSIDLVAKTDLTAAAEGKSKIVSKGDAAFGSSGGITYIGGDGTDGNYQFVQTVAGPSSKVKAKM